MTASNQNVVVYQSNAKNLRITVYDDDQGGQAEDDRKSLTDATITYIVKRRVDFDSVEITKEIGTGITIISAANGRFDILLSNVDTAGLSPGVWYHECQVADASGYESTVFVGFLTVKEAAITLVPSPQTPGVVELFSDVTGTLLVNHEPDLAPEGFIWSEWRLGSFSPAFTIQGNQCDASPNGSGNTRGYNGESGLADCVVMVEGVRNSTATFQPILVFRGNLVGAVVDDGARRGWMVSIEGTVARLVNPALVIVDSESLTLGVGDSFRITATLDGDDISVLLENLTDLTSVTLTATSSVQATFTSHGFGAFYQSGAGVADRFDNFSVTEL